MLLDAIAATCAHATAEHRLRTWSAWRATVQTLAYWQRAGEMVAAVAACRAAHPEVVHVDLLEQHAVLGDGSTAGALWHPWSPVVPLTEDRAQWTAGGLRHPERVDGTEVVHAPDDVRSRAVRAHMGHSPAAGWLWEAGRALDAQISRAAHVAVGAALDDGTLACEETLVVVCADVFTEPWTQPASHAVLDYLAAHGAGPQALALARPGSTVITPVGIRVQHAM